MRVSGNDIHEIAELDPKDAFQSFELGLSFRIQSIHFVLVQVERGIGSSRHFIANLAPKRSSLGFRKFFALPGCVCKGNISECDW